MSRGGLSKPLLKARAETYRFPVDGVHTVHTRARRAPLLQQGGYREPVKLQHAKARRKRAKQAIIKLKGAPGR